MNTDTPQSAKPFLDISMMLPLSYLADTRLKNAVADSLPQGQMPNSSTISGGDFTLADVAQA